MRTTFPEPGTAVTCGVSGGADSTALLVLAVAAGCDAEAVHVDHGLRPGSAREADVVAATAERVGARFRSVTAPVEPGSNLEARARAVRHAALPEGALLGHTADDQAETVLLALLRGAGIDGLGGMRSDRRPLLSLRRSETSALCAALGFETVDDPSNRDPAFRRTRVRHEVVPVLSDVAHRDIVPVLARQAELLRDEGRFLDDLAAELDPADVAALRGAPVVLARRALRRWLRTEHPPAAADIERVLRVVAGEHVATEVGGRRIARRGGRLIVEAASATETGW